MLLMMLNLRIQTILYLFLIFTCHVHCENLKDKVHETHRIDEVDYILKLLRTGDENIKMEKDGDVVLLVGNTGAGKSTLANFLGYNSSKLKSIETSPESCEYIIVSDQANQQSTIISQTIFPELIINPITKTAFYDCPGFSDTRGVSHDIAGTYFTKNVIDTAKRVKLVFVINYHSVRIGVDRLDFMLLVKHATTFIKDVTKFRNSIALIVTKVDSRYHKSGQLVRDEVIISSTGDFIKEVKKSLEEEKVAKNENSNLGQFYDNALNLIEILLDHDGQHYTRIGIFRRPNDPGPLDEIELFQSAKKYLEKIINVNIDFVEKKEGDFGYTISAESKNRVQDLILLLKEHIYSNLKQIGEKFKNHFELIELSNDIYSLHEIFTNTLKVFTEFNLNTKSNDIEFFKSTIKTLELKEDVFNENLESIYDSEKKLKFLKNFSNQSSIYTSDYSVGFSALQKYLKNSQKWYSFLIQLYITLSEHFAQKKAQVLKELIQANLEKSEITTANDLGAVNSLIEWIKMKVGGGHSLEVIASDLGDISLNKGKLSCLSNVLNTTLNHNTILEHPTEEKLVIKGKYILLSDIDNMLLHNKKVIEVYSTNKIFIDVDLNKTGDNAQISFVSPVWEINGDRKIIVDGKPGDCQEKAENGRTASPRGKDGKAGKAGGAAGNFYGLAGYVIGGVLEVFAKGGKGGRGQDGGDGADGMKGEDGPDPNYITIQNWDGYWHFSGFKCKVKPISSNTIIVISNARYEYIGEGTKATNGGDGGNGGVGGKGGYGGMIDIQVLGSKTAEILNFTSPGDEGENGKGGKGGLGASHGRTIMAVMDYTNIALIIPLSTRWRVYASEDAGKSGNGKAGLSGKEGGVLEEPETGAVMADSSTIINSYKDFISEYLGKDIWDPSLSSFLKHLDNLTNVDNEIEETSLLLEDFSHQP